MSIFATVSGRLGRDPETRTTPNGNSVCSFSVATDYGYGDRKTTTWVRVSVWGKQGETAQRFLAKGREVVCSGELHTRTYEKDGVTNTSVELDCKGFDLVGGRSEGQPAGNGGGNRNQPTGQGGGSYDDDSIPF